MGADPRVGTELAGHQILAVIGRGGMAVVYLAEHLRLGRRVALKVLDPEVAEDEGFRERFIRESRIAAGLDHPNVVTVYDAGEAEGVLYLSMRYVEGTDLERLLRAETHLEPFRAVSIISQCAAALDAAHAEGLVHRDVKPGNILLSSDRRNSTDQVYLADFGVSKRIHTEAGLTRTGQFVGTVDYVAPEQIRGEDVDGRADVYSLGCVLYRCLTGEVPFPRETEVGTIYAHLQDGPKAPSVGWPGIPSAVDEVISQALAKSRGERFATCHALAQAAAGAFGPAAPRARDQRLPELSGLGEVRKTVTVVFCDVVGSTTLGEKLDPESLRMVMSRYFDEMKSVLESHGGTVEKFIGDAVMAVFGVPTLHEDDALRAVRAADEMRGALAALNKQLERDHDVTLAARIGVNTGEVVAGDATGGQALVTGHAVSVAARLEQAAAPGEVVIGEDTFRFVRDAVVTEPLEPLIVKGKSEPVRALRLVDLISWPTAHVPPMDSPMVGRERPLSLLVQTFEQVVADRACHLFTILGTPGVGKSRLIEEFVNRVGDRAAVLRGRCLPYGEGITYFPVLEVIKQAAGLADFDPPDVVEEKVCRILEGDEHQEVVCGRLSQLLGAGGTAVPEETFFAVRLFLEAIARDRPLIVVFDDIHWGETTFLDLVEHVADWSREVPIFLACIARTELIDVRPTWGGGKLNATAFSLEPLTDEESDLLITNLVGAAEVGSEVKRRIEERAEGNPLFVEQMLSMLIDDGLIAREGGGWVPAGDLTAVTVPPTTRALLAARLERLPEQERSVLGQASVVGRVFYRSAVEELSPTEARASVAASLMTLVRKQFVRRDTTTLLGEEAFRFRHLLIRDAAYDAMRKELRAELHERFADWLERVAGIRIAEQEEIVGYHLERAFRLRAELWSADERSRDLAGRAASRLYSSGIRALDRGDASGAVNLLGRTVDLLPSGDKLRPDAVLLLGDALGDRGELRQAMSTYEDAIGLGRAAGDRRVEWRARTGLAWINDTVETESANLQKLRKEAEEAIHVLAELGDDLGLARAWWVLADVHGALCHSGDMVKAAEQELHHARRTGRPREIAAALFVEAAGLVSGPTPADEGVACLERALAEFRDLPVVRLWTLHVLGELEGTRGRFDAARAILDESIELARQYGNLWLVFFATWRRATVERWAGDLAASQGCFRSAVEVQKGLGERGVLSTLLADFARTELELGHDDETLQLADRCRELAAPDDVASQMLWRSMRARVLAVRGELDEGEQLARDAVDLARTTDMLVWIGEALVDLAEVLREAGRPEEARSLAQEALELFERKGAVPHAAKARALLEKLTL
jgi:serine/threonine protein kinase/tetratricopeptide (TPR) repeat protein